MLCNLFYMKNSYPDLDYKSISEILNYDELTGKITWKVKRANNISIGQVAGVIDKNGYRRIKIRPKLYLAHRIAWLLHHKEWPKNLIDHINMNRDDNRISNLREATKSQNMMNTKKYQTNTSGIKGVSWHKRDKVYRADITIMGKHIYVGRYKTKEEAGKAIVFKRLELHGEFSHH